MQETKLNLAYRTIACYNSTVSKKALLKKGS